MTPVLMIEKNAYIAYYIRNVHAGKGLFCSDLPGETELLLERGTSEQ